MNKEWVEQRNKSNYANTVKGAKELIEMLNRITFSTDGQEKKEMVLKALRDVAKSPSRTTGYTLESIIIDAWGQWNEFIEDKEQEIEWNNVFFSKCHEIAEKAEYLTNYYDKCLDSECVEFDEDIIVTDPGYFVKEEDKKISGNGTNAGVLGFTRYICHDGETDACGIACSNTDTKELLGRVSTCLGQIGVYSLDEVLKYNPNCSEIYDKDWYGSNSTIIRNFKGTVQYYVVRCADDEKISQEKKDFYKFRTENERWFDFVIKIIGHGVNKITSKPINFMLIKEDL